MNEELKSDPKPEYFVDLAYSQELQKKYKEANTNYKKAIILDKNNYKATIKCAVMLANLGEGQRATKYFKHALKIDPLSVDAHFGIGKCLQ